MLINTGYGLGGPHCIARNQVTSLNLILGFDSITNAFFSVTGGVAALEGRALADGYESVTIHDFAQGGVGVYKTLVQTDSAGSTLYMWDDDTNAPSAKYTSNRAYMSNPEAANAVVIYVGTNDALREDLYPGVPTVADFKTNLQELFDYMRTDFPNAHFFGLGLIHRSDYATELLTTSYNAIRQAQLEFIAENEEWVKRMPDIYDLDNSDEVHPANANYQSGGEFVNRIVDAVAAYHGKRSLTGVLGPQITAADWHGDYMLASVDLDGGSDFATIPSGAEVFFKVKFGSALITPAAVTRHNASQLKLDFADLTPRTGTKTLYAGYGQLGQLERTDVEAIYSNVVGTPPLRMGIHGVTNHDLIADLTGLAAYLHPKAGAKAYESGAVLSGIADVVSGSNWMTSTGRGPTYDATAFGGVGGLVAADQSTHLLSPAFTAGSALFAGLVLEFPASYDANRQFMYLGTNASGSSNANLLVSSGTGKITYGRDQAAGFPTVYNSDTRNTRAVVLINWRSASAVDVYWNNASSPVTFDPNDAFNAQTYMWLFSGSSGGTSLNGLKVGAAFLKNGAHDAVNDPSIANLMSYLKTRFGVA